MHKFGRQPLPEDRPCTECKRELPPGSYYRIGANRDSRCKECRKRRVYARRRRQRQTAS